MSRLVSKRLRLGRGSNFRPVARLRCWRRDSGSWSVAPFFFHALCMALIEEERMSHANGSRHCHRSQTENTPIVFRRRSRPEAGAVKERPDLLGDLRCPSTVTQQLPETLG